MGSKPSRVLKNPPVSRWLRVSPKRALFMAIGVLAVGLALLGVVVPGLPTTVFLLVGSYFLTRSCPYLEERLIQNRVFRPYLSYLDGSRPMPRRAKAITIVVMWASVSVSLLMLARQGNTPTWLSIGIALAALAGTWFIAFGIDRVRRTS